MSCHVMSCHVMPCDAMPCHAMSCRHARVCHVKRRHATSRHITLHHGRAGLGEQKEEQGLKGSRRKCKVGRARGPKARAGLRQALDPETGPDAVMHLRLCAGRVPVVGLWRSRGERTPTNRPWKKVMDSLSQRRCTVGDFDGVF